MARNPGLSTQAAIEQAYASMERSIESMTNLGPHALEKLAPGGTVDVIFWETDIARELTELTQHTYMDPVTGQRFRLEITSGPQSVPRTAAPFSPGDGVPSNVRVVSQVIMKKVSVQ